MKSTAVLQAYLATVFVVSYLWQGLIYGTGGVESNILPFMMLFPGIVAVAFRVWTKEGFGNVGWGLRRWWYVLPAVVIPLLVVLSVALVLLTLNWAALSDKHFVFDKGMVEVKKIPLILGNDTQSSGFFALNLSLSLFVQSVLGSLLTVGEEFGWRGYAQKRFIDILGLNRGLVSLGLVWGYWHLPIGLMGWNFPAHPVLGALVLTPISNVFLGVVLGWLYLRSRSIWMPTVAHASVNLTASLLFAELIMQGDGLYLQLGFIAVWGVVATLCLMSLNRRRPVL